MSKNNGCTFPPSTETYDQAYVAVLRKVDLSPPDPEPSAMSDNPFTCDGTEDELTHPGGLVEDLTDWIVSSSETPCRTLAQAAVLAFTGALIGRRFATPTDLRSNLYCVGIAPSGFGKEHARAQLKRLIVAAGLTAFSGPARFMSSSALRNTISDQPSFVSMIDEFGGMLETILDRRAGNHNLQLRNDMLEYFSCAGSYFDGAAYAGSKAVKIYNPNFCLYGTSTPNDFWRVLTSANTADGLLARLLIFVVDRPKPPPTIPQRSVHEVPDDLVVRCQALAMAGRRAGNIASQPKLDNGNVGVTPRIVQHAPEAEQSLRDFKSFIDMSLPKAAVEAVPVLNRTVEHALKLALIASVATNYEEPLISVNNMEWAIGQAWHCTCAMIEQAADRISDNAREASLKRILLHIKNSGADGITLGKIADKTPSIERRVRTEILEDLVLADHIEWRLRTGTGGRSSGRYFWKN